MSEGVTLKFWHGGMFIVDKNGHLCYLGGEGRTFLVDPDELCGFYLRELVQKCGDYENILGIYYLIPGMTLAEGLRKVFNDEEVRKMAEIVKVDRCIELYVFHMGDSPELLGTEILSTQTGETNPHKEAQITFTATTKRPKKMTPKRKAPQTQLRTSPRLKIPNLSSQKIPCTTDTELTHSKENLVSHNHSKLTATTSSTLSNKYFFVIVENTYTEPPVIGTKIVTTCVPEDYDWEEERPESPIPWQDLIGPEHSSDSDRTDPEFNPDSEAHSADEDETWKDDLIDEREFIEEDYAEDEFHLNEGNAEDAETSDDEYYEARDKVKGFTQKVLDLAKKLQKDAKQGRLDAQQVPSKPTASNRGLETLVNLQVVMVTQMTTLTHPLTVQMRETLRWAVGQRFATRNDFKQAVAKFGILQGRNVSIHISDKGRQQRLGVKCAEGCPFRLYASWESRRATYVVKTVIGEHTCVRNMERNKQCKSSWMAEQLLEVFKARPHWPAKEIIECIRQAYRVMVKRDFAYKVKYRAHKLLHGSMTEHYIKVGRYVAALKAASPSSDVELVTYKKKGCAKLVFQRLYMCFEGVKKGWIEGCRRIICVDTCFLKTFLGGQLMTAVGRDGNDQMYPIAWAVVEGENNLSWNWFFTQLQHSLSLEKGEGLVLISDEHQLIIKYSDVTGNVADYFAYNATDYATTYATDYATAYATDYATHNAIDYAMIMGILNGVVSVFPLAEHRHCARHIFALWHKTYRGDEMKLLFWNIVMAYNMADYEDGLEALNKVSSEAALAFQKYNPKLFCRAYMTITCKANVITNNMAETFNGYIINARNKHLIYMLKDIRTSLMQRLMVKKAEMEKCNGIVCPRIQQKLDKEKVEAAKCNVMPSSSTVFQVHHYLDYLTVDLEARKYTCRKWDMCGFPCCHAIACIFFCHQNAEDYVDECYKKQVYLKAYSGSISPLEGERHWSRVEVPLETPPIKIGPGRPRKSRIKDPFENPKKAGKLTKHGMQMICRNCKTKGQNKRRCPNRGNDAQPEQPQPKKARGRPKSTPSPVVPSADSDKHHCNTAEPSRLRKGVRVISRGRGRASGTIGEAAGSRGSGARSTGRGVGSKGSASGIGASRGRGRGKTTMPQGHGVLFDDQGSMMTNVPGQSSGPRLIGQRSINSVKHQP